MTKTIFVIDTDSYAGNFERDLCAYVTGVIGECSVGEEYAKLYYQETGEVCSQFEDNIDRRSDDNGCCRPTSLYPTKGWLYDGGTGKVPEAEFNQEVANEKYRIHTAKYFQDQLAHTEKIDVNNERYKKAGWNESSKAKEINRLQKEIDRCLSEKTVCPRTAPNNSVAIFFNGTPSDKQIAIMKERAAKFAETKRRIAEEEDLSWDKNFQLTIYGFRLVTESTSSEEKTI
jgi:hypothetical protein